jgi:hypothetical protein
MPSRADTASPSADGPVERIGRIADVIASSGAANEALGRLTPEVVDKLHEQRLFRLLLPRAYDGDEVDPATWFRAMEALAKLDGSTAWCVGQINGCAMSAKTPGEHLSAPGQTAGDRAFGPAQFLCRFRSRFALQIARHQSHAVLVRQPIQLLIEKREHGVVPLRLGWRLRKCVRRPFARAPFDGHRSRLPCGLDRNAVQPVADHASWFDGVRLAQQHQKGCLERIFGILNIAENSLTDTHHQRPVFLHEHGKRYFVPFNDKSI